MRFDWHARFTAPANHQVRGTESNERIFKFQTVVGVGTNLKNMGDFTS